MNLLKRRWFLFLALVLSLGVLGFGLHLYTQVNAGPETALVVNVIDGDTVILENGEHVRYIGIDAPEKGDYYYKEATEENTKLVLNKTVTLVKDVSDRDRYGRLLRYVYIDGVFVNAELVKTGCARADAYPPDLAHRMDFGQLWEEAKLSETGMYRPTPVPYKAPIFSVPKTTPIPTYQPPLTPPGVIKKRF